jgi:hypothetical protein
VPDRLTLLHATLAFAVLPPTEPELVMLHRWLDTWRGVGDIVMGMRRLGFKLGLEWAVPVAQDRRVADDNGRG